MAYPDWHLVMALWGDRYGAADVNRLAGAARAGSATCRGVILVTDRPRDGVDAAVRQIPFPGAFATPECFAPGYPAKLAVFAPEVVPAQALCVYLDLDTLVLGDLGRLAARVDSPEALLMLPPAGPVGFGALRRGLFALTGGRRVATGNSSIMAWHTGAAHNIADAWRAGGAAGAAHRGIDDAFISWCAQDRLRGVPPELAVRFRRGFMTRVPGLATARHRWGRRLDGLVAVTFDSPACKPAELARLPDATPIRDGRGRRAIWSQAAMGPVWHGVRAGWGGQ